MLPAPDQCAIALVMWLVVRWGDDAPGPHRDRWLVLIAYVLALTSTNHLMGLLAVPALHKDGRQISVEFTILPLHDDAGTILGIAAFLRDVTARFEEVRGLRRELAALKNREPQRSGA